MQQKYYDCVMTEEIQHSHANMVAKLSGRIAQQANYTDDTVSLIKEAARLHDIGKHYLPVGLLSKPGKLSDREYEMVKQHSVYGFEHLVQHIKVMMAAAIISLQHHEQVGGGNGYPGTDFIHPYAKLVAVADVFDALLSQRSYKDPWPPSDIIQRMSDGRNVHFEGVYIDALMGAMDEVLAMYEDSRKAAS